MSEKHDSLGNRMKECYEDRYRICLTRRTPVIIRLDGRAFHSLTKHFDKPFDKGFMQSMVFSAIRTAEEIQGYKLGYVQSDEVSILLCDFDKEETEAWFDYNLSKMISISASMMSVYFNIELSRYTHDFGHMGVFDSRAFNVPLDDVPNYFIWRYKDCVRNSLQMYCQSFFSPKQLLNKGSSDQHKMLHDIGRNWAEDLSWREKNGTFIFPGANISDNLGWNGEINYSIIDNWIKKNPFEKEV